MSEQEKEKEIESETEAESSKDEIEFFTESNKFKQMMFENLNGISAKFNLKYPINPKLTYEYPPINPIICQNIISALYKYPKFYTQTLHLMNKMNLPCPLVDYVRDQAYPLNVYMNYSEVQHVVQTQQQQQHPPAEAESSSESEIETDYVPANTVAAQTVTQLAESEVKKVNIKSLLKSASSQHVQSHPTESTTSKPTLDEVFDRS